MTRYALALGSALLAGCLLAIPNPAPAQPGAKEKPKASRRDLALAAKVLDGTAGADAPLMATGQVGKKVYPVFNIEFVSAKACAAFSAKGLHVFSRFEEFADVFVVGDEGKASLQALKANPDVVWFERGGVAEPPPPPTPAEKGEKGRDMPEDVVRDGIGDLNGKGVIIAVVDTGVDFRHPDFIRIGADGKPTSRLLYYWDTLGAGPAAGEPGSKAPVSYPDGTSIGTVYTAEELTAELRSAQKKILPVPDDDGHGTACASVAAGNGSAAAKEQRKGHSGVAPGADLIAVRVGGSKGLGNTYLIGSICGWVDAMARKHNRPVVLSYSVGGQYGAHDGSRIIERQLTKRFPPDAAGRAICIAAGNEGRNSLHGEVEFGGTTAKGELTWVSINKPSLEIYCDSADPGDIVVTGATVYEISYHPLAKGVVCDLDIRPSRVNKDTGNHESDKLQIHTKSGKKVKADAYMPGLNTQGYFTGDCAEYGKQISTPATAEGVIAVGSYDWNNKFHFDGSLYDLPVFIGRNYKKEKGPFRAGVLSAYSNPGPNRTGKAVKPEVVAPGQWWTAAAPPNVKVEYDTSKRYQLFNGTSAATPYTAGVIALMLQKKATLTSGEIKTLLARNASKDYEGSIDKGDPAKNPGWGHGKLDVKAVTNILKAIP